MMQEVHHNRPEQVEKYLADAAAIVARLELTDELRVPAFTIAVQLLAAKTFVQPQPVAIPRMAVPRQ